MARQGHKNSNWPKINKIHVVLIFLLFHSIRLFKLLLQSRRVWQGDKDNDGDRTVIFHDKDGTTGGRDGFHIYRELL